MSAIKPMNTDEFEARRKKATKPMLWLGMVSIVMIFAALTSYSIVAHSNGKWTPISVPSMFIVSTVLILISSISMHWSLLSAKKNDYSKVKWGIIITLVLGICFAISQFMAYKELINENIYFTGKQSFVSGSIMYLITFLHLLHLLGGLICLTVGYFMARKNKYNSDNSLGLQLISTYWHFLDGLWVYLFIFLNILAH